MGLRSDLTNIANAIRAKNGLSISYHISEMASAIENIPSGGNGGVDWGKIIDGTISGNLNCTSAMSIRAYAFSQCSYLTGVSFQNATAIGNLAFAGCINLHELNFPNVTNLNQTAFSNCSSITSISFGSMSSTTIAFKSQRFLESAYFPKASIITANAFVGCIKLSDVSFPSCKTVSTYAFSGCSQLNTISLPMLSTIGSYAFNSCTMLESVYLNVSIVPTFSPSSASSTAFYRTPISNYTTALGHYGSIYVPTSLYNGFRQSTLWSNYLSRIVPYDFENNVISYPT